MADKFDDLIHDIADAADARIDYNAMKLAALEQARADKVRKLRTLRYTGMAAGFVVLAGIGALFATGKFGGANKAAMDTVAPTSYALTEGYDSAPAPVAEADLATGGMEDNGLMMAEAPIDYGDSVPMTDSPVSSASGAADDVQEAFDIVTVGELDFSRSGFPKSEAGTGKNLMYCVVAGTDCALEVGEAVIFDNGDSIYAVWRTNELDHLRIDAYGYTRDELVELMESMAS